MKFMIENSCIIWYHVSYLLITSIINISKATRYIMIDNTHRVRDTFNRDIRLNRP